MKKLFAMLLALCMLCGAMTAAAENATQEVTIGRATFQLPAEMEIVAEEEVGIIATCEGYEISLLVYPYPASLLEESKSPGLTMQTWNLLIMLEACGMSNQAASTIAIYLSTEEDIGMPDGWGVSSVQLEDIVFVSHCYDDFGILIMAVSETGADLQKMLQTGKEIMLTFRLDGMTAEEMAADAQRRTEAVAEKVAAQQYVVITNSSANIRSGPDGSAAKITTAVQGDTFPLLGEDGNWYIIDVNGQTGYVTKSLSAIQ